MHGRKNRSGVAAALATALCCLATAAHSQPSEPPPGELRCADLKVPGPDLTIPVSLGPSEASTPIPGARSSAAAGITLNNSGAVTTRARTGSGEWSGVASAYFTIGSQPPSAANVVFSELHYHPAPPNRARPNRPSCKWN